MIRMERRMRGGQRRGYKSVRSGSMNCISNLDLSSMDHEHHLCSNIVHNILRSNILT
jgi:hypothetical protein